METFQSRNIVPVNSDHPVMETPLASQFFALQHELEQTEDEGITFTDIFTKTLQVIRDSANSKGYAEVATALSEESITQSAHAFTSALYGIPMKDTLYENVISSLPRLYDAVDGVCLYSKATKDGYQKAKIAQSTIQEELIHAQQQAREKGKEVFTTSFIDPHKEDGIDSVLTQFTKENPTEPIRVVVLDDQVSNLTKSKQAIDQYMQDNHNFAIEPLLVWSKSGRIVSSLTKEQEEANRKSADATVTKLPELITFLQTQPPKKTILFVNFPRPYGRGFSLFQTEFALHLFYPDSQYML